MSLTIKKEPFYVRIFVSLVSISLFKISFAEKVPTTFNPPIPRVHSRNAKLARDFNDKYGWINVG